MVDKKMVKGAVVNGYLKYVKKKWGTMGYKEALQSLGISSEPKDSEWVPAEMATDVLNWIRENKGEQHVGGAGRYASQDLGVFTYMVASFMSIERFMKKAQVHIAPFLIMVNL